MNSQESAAENDLKDLNSNFNAEEPAMPKGGFFDMVEHPSINDDHEDDDDAYEDDDFEEDGITGEEPDDDKHAGSMTDSQ